VAVGREKLGGREQGAPVLDIRRRTDDLLHLLMGEAQKPKVMQAIRYKRIKMLLDFFLLMVKHIQ
jgi:hypothetical protein